MITRIFKTSLRAHRMNLLTGRHPRTTLLRTFSRKFETSKDRNIQIVESTKEETGLSEGVDESYDPAAFHKVNDPGLVEALLRYDMIH